MHNLKKQYKFIEVDGKLVLDEIVFTNVDYTFYQKAFNHIKRNKILYARLVFSLAYAMFLSANPTLIFANPCAWLENMGNGAISVVQMTGVKILTLAMILELIREGMRGGTHNISTILTRYALLVSGVLLAPTFISMLEAFAKTYRP